MKGLFKAIGSFLGKNNAYTNNIYTSNTSTSRESSGLKAEGNNNGRDTVCTCWTPDNLNGEIAELIAYNAFSSAAALARDGYYKCDNCRQKNC